ALAARPKLSDRGIANQVGVSHQTVANQRQAIYQNLTDSSYREVTRNGTSYTMQTGNIGQRVASAETDEEEEDEQADKDSDGETDDLASDESEDKESSQEADERSKLSLQFGEIEREVTRNGTTYTMQTGKIGHGEQQATRSNGSLFDDDTEDEDE